MSKTAEDARNQEEDICPYCGAEINGTQEAECCKKLKEQQNKPSSLYERLQELRGDRPFLHHQVTATPAPGDNPPEPEGCGHSSVWLRPDTDPAHDICVQHDRDYDAGFDSYWDVLKADARFTWALWKRTATLVVESVIYPPIIHIWALIKRPWKKPGGTT